MFSYKNDLSLKYFMIKGFATLTFSIYNIFVKVTNDHFITLNYAYKQF